MSVKLGLVAFLEAKPDKAEELGAFLQQGRELAGAEEGRSAGTCWRRTPTSARSMSSP